MERGLLKDTKCREELLQKRFLSSGMVVNMDKVNIPNILSIVGAIFIAAVVSTLIFSVLNALGLYGEAAKALVQIIDCPCSDSGF